MSQQADPRSRDHKIRNRLAFAAGVLLGLSDDDKVIRRLSAFLIEDAEWIDLKLAGVSDPDAFTAPASVLEAALRGMSSCDDPNCESCNPKGESNE